MACDVYMGAKDVERQRLNVPYRDDGATVPGTSTRALRTVDAFGAWMDDPFYVLERGPHPYQLLFMSSKVIE